MRAFREFFSFLILLVLGGGCARPLSESGLQNSIERYQSLPQTSRSGLNPNETSRWQAARPLSSVSSRAHYRIQGEFVSNESNLILHSHFNGFPKSDGLQLSFRKRDKDLILLYSSPQIKGPAASVLENYFLDRSKLDISVEVHNLTSSSQALSRILVWIDPVHPVTKEILPRQTFFASQAAFDTEKAEVRLGSGEGVFWGIEYRGLRSVEVERRPAWVR